MCEYKGACVGHRQFVADRGECTCLVLLAGFMAGTAWLFCCLSLSLSLVSPPPRGCSTAPTTTAGGGGATAVLLLVCCSYAGLPLLLVWLRTATVVAVVIAAPWLLSLLLCRCWYRCAWWLLLVDAPMALLVVAAVCACGWQRSHLQYAAAVLAGGS